MRNIFDTIISMSICASILAVFVFILKPFLQNRISKNCQYYIWIIFVIKLIIPISIGIDITGYIFERLEYKDKINSVSSDYSTEYNLSQKDDIDYYSKNIVESNPIKYIDIVLSNLWIVWIFGMIISIAIKVTSYRNFIKYISFGNSEIVDESILEVFDDVFIELNIKQNVNLYKNKNITSPMLIGITKSSVVIPESYDNFNSLRIIFKHELIHFKRKDILYKWATQFVSSVHWFNPIVYFVCRDIDRLCEISCDELVLKNSSSNERNTYGNALISIAALGTTYKNDIASTTMYEDKKILKNRLNFIANYNDLNRVSINISFLIISFLIFMSLTIGGKDFVFKNSYSYSNNLNYYEYPVFYRYVNSIDGNIYSNIESKKVQEYINSGYISIIDYYIEDKLYPSSNEQGYFDVFDNSSISINISIQNLESVENSLNIHESGIKLKLISPDNKSYEFKVVENDLNENLDLNKSLDIYSGRWYYYIDYSFTNSDIPAHMRIDIKYDSIYPKNIDWLNKNNGNRQS